MSKELPSGWKWTKLEEVCEIISGKNQSKVINPKGKYPIYGSSGIFGYADEYLCKEGTTVVGRKGTINSPLYVNTKFWNVDTAFGLSPNKDYDNKLLYYFCLSFNFHELDKSTTIPSLAKRDLLAIDIPLPPKPTQLAIVSKIEELFSELDKAIEQLKTAQQQLKTYRQSVLKWAFEGKLTNNVWTGVRFPSTPPELSMAAEPEVAYGNSELPEGWKWVKVCDIAKVETGTTPSKSNPAFYGREYPFYKPTDLEAGENVFKSSDGLTKLGVDAARYVPENSILVTCIGATIGKTGFIKKGGGFNQQINAIVPNNGLNPKFIYYQTIGLHFQKQIIDNASATTLPIINKGKFQVLEMTICPLEEQNQIVQEIENRLSVADKMEESINQSLQQAEALRQSILKKAFEGRLV